MTPTNAEVLRVVAGARMMRDCPACSGDGCAICGSSGSAWAGTDAEVFTADCIAIEMLTRLCGLPEITDDRDLVAAWDDSDGFEPSPYGQRKEPSEWHAMLSREMHHRLNQLEIDEHLEALERERNPGPVLRVAGGEMRLKSAEVQP
jgi:hypothetical protein